MNNPKGHPALYDDIAENYDEYFSDQFSIQEDKELFSLLSLPSNDASILDIGCGTGLLLDYCNIPPRYYTGIDPSQAMLSQLIKKHPSYAGNVIQSKFENFDGGKYHVIVSLYGSLNYVAQHSLSRISDMLHKDGRFFLMFYKPDYVPLINRLAQKNIPYFATNILYVSQTFGKIREFHNFLIVTNNKHLHSST